MTYKTYMIHQVHMTYKTYVIFKACITHIDLNLKKYIAEVAWRNRMTITDYLNNLIKADMEKQDGDWTHKL